MDSEIYEIDYRGPETHSRVPPPGHSHGKSYSPHHPKSSVAAAQEAMGLTGTHAIMKQKASISPPTGGLVVCNGMDMPLPLPLPKKKASINIL